MRVIRLRPRECPEEPWPKDILRSFGDGEKIDWAKEIGTRTRYDRMTVELFTRWHEWARTGVEPPPWGRVRRIFWKIRKRLEYDPDTVPKNSQK
ncbi:hypothetical protein SMC26_45635 [Actinomadura fulvescens]|uniref:Uncharacterized protein n=1 Tax=Actinomadura fulvescens TaxID=46160 RepID=A0ABN3PGS6_9ACTN